MNKLWFIIFVSILLINCNNITTTSVESSTETVEVVKEKKSLITDQKKFTGREDMLGAQNIGVLEIPGNKPLDWGELEFFFASRVSDIVFYTMSKEKWVNCGRDLNKMSIDDRETVAFWWGKAVIGTARYLKDLIPISEEDGQDILDILNESYNNWKFDLCAYSQDIKCVSTTDLNRI